MRKTINNKQKEIKAAYRNDHYSADVIKKFLWTPLLIGNEWRWLETAYVERVPFIKMKRRSVKYYWAFAAWID